jgi:hypothetical protein
MISPAVSPCTGRFQRGDSSCTAACRGIRGSFTHVKGASPSQEEILAGCRQPEGLIPVTPDSVFVIAGLMANELFGNLSGRPKLLDRFLVELSPKRRLRFYPPL